MTARPIAPALYGPLLRDPVAREVRAAREELTETLRLLDAREQLERETD